MGRLRIPARLAVTAVLSGTLGGIVIAAPVIAAPLPVVPAFPAVADSGGTVADAGDAVEDSSDTPTLSFEQFNKLPSELKGLIANQPWNEDLNVFELVKLSRVNKEFNLFTQQRIAALKAATVYTQEQLTKRLADPTATFVLVIPTRKLDIETVKNPDIHILIYDPKPPHDDRFIDITATVKFTAIGNSYVKAWHRAEGTLQDNARAEAWGIARLTAEGNSRVDAFHQSHITATDNSRVAGYGQSTIVADGNATVYACTCNAAASVTVSGSTVRVFGKAGNVDRIVAEDRSTVRALPEEELREISDSYKVPGELPQPGEPPLPGTFP